jgi:hypothetical protein
MGIGSKARKVLGALSHPAVRIGLNFALKDHSGRATNILEAIQIAVGVVKAVEVAGPSGKDKMTAAIKLAGPSLLGMGLKKESEVRWVVETALQVAEGKITLE